MIAPEPPPLAPGEVHVWWFGLDRESAELAALEGLLAEEERRRIARYQFGRDRDRATAARGVLRALLGRYVGCDPTRLRIEYAEHGKPFLSGHPVEFNLSHSRGLGVCAIARNAPVGVDVEYMQPDVDHAGVADTFFSPAERAGVATALDFYRCWTLKEAYIKARGGGLSIPLDAFDVPLTGKTTDQPQPVLSREVAPAAHGWFVRELRAAQDFVAAIAVRSPHVTIREWQGEPLINLVPPSRNSRR